MTETKKKRDVQKLRIAVIGGGIIGSCAAQVLMDDAYNRTEGNLPMEVHLFDKGRRGVGGRSSSRSQSYSDDKNGCLSVMKWDHGCQFFRADTERFQCLVKELISEGIVKEWNGDFRSSSQTISDKLDFFGMPSMPPFYIGVDGMQGVTKGMIERMLHKQKNEAEENGNNSETPLSDQLSSKLIVFTGTRVDNLERDATSAKWRLWGTGGEAAYHDTPEKIAQEMNQGILLGNEQGYDAVILTDANSTFGKWYRASAGVPESFCSRVKTRVGSRVPLFTAMIAFDTESAIPFDAAIFDNDVLWFASKTNSKLDNNIEPMKECWTLVSTPEYAMAKIEETPMQDPITGEFIPQTNDYLLTVPGPDLKEAFCNEVTSNRGILGNEKLECLPEIIHLDAQRWGCAMPAHRHLGESSSTRKIISGVSYDSGRSSLAPTIMTQPLENSTQKSFLVDGNLMLLQAGDTVSSFTPGFEGAAISGMDAAQYLLDYFSQQK